MLLDPGLSRSLCWWLGGGFDDWSLGRGPLPLGHLRALGGELGGPNWGLLVTSFPPPTTSPPSTTPASCASSGAFLLPLVMGWHEPPVSFVERELRERVRGGRGGCLVWGVGRLPYSPYPMGALALLDRRLDGA